MSKDGGNKLEQVTSYIVEKQLRFYEYLNDANEFTNFQIILLVSLFCLGASIWSFKIFIALLAYVVIDMGLYFSGKDYGKKKNQKMDNIADEVLG